MKKKKRRKMFWQDHCPVRQPGLHHVHDIECDAGHLPQQCCECGMLSTDWTEPDLTVLTKDERAALRKIAEGVAAGYYKS